MLLIENLKERMPSQLTADNLLSATNEISINSTEEEPGK
jgi:hypothetical protein